MYDVLQVFANLINGVLLRSKGSFNQLRQSADLALLLLQEYSGDDCGLSFTGRVRYFLKDKDKDLALLHLKEYSGDDCGLSFTGKVRLSYTYTTK